MPFQMLCIIWMSPLGMLPPLHSISLKEAAGHVKVVLSGEGADELFGGYNIYREPESLKKIDWIPFGVRRVIGKLAAKLPDVKGRDFLIRAGMKWKNVSSEMHIFTVKKRKRRFSKNKVTGPSTQEYLRPFFEELESENRGLLQDMEKMQSVDLRYWLPGDILQKADKMSMAHSLEVRGTILDKEVFDLQPSFRKKPRLQRVQPNIFSVKLFQNFFHRKPMNVGNLVFQFQSVCGCGRMTGIRG